ncbi:MAG: hypothetical protein J4G18_08015 [Anaerolineae bacterium]|nr:hypothetical protein [Anaerolineae bacterium]
MYKFKIFLSHHSDDDAVVQALSDAGTRNDVEFGPQVREYQRPRFVTRFLENSVGGVRCGLKVIFDTDVIMTLYDEEWLYKDVCHEPKHNVGGNACKRMSWEEYFRRLIKDQHQFEKDSERRLQNQSQMDVEEAAQEPA